jgi:Icc-related predicted phosphoesterase
MTENGGITKMMRIYAVSDLHGYFPPYVPECELLLLGGDYCPTRNLEQEKRFMSGKFSEWLREVPAKQVVGIAGNHDFILQDEPEFARSLPWTYLQDEEINIDGVRIYGTPWTPPFFDWAFMCNESMLQERFSNIPEGLDILLSHGPAWKHLDQNSGKENCGSYSLLQRIKQVKPDSHVFGHIHEGHGVMDDGPTRFYNVAYLNGKYEPKYNCVNIPLKAEK